MFRWRLSGDHSRVNVLGNMALVQAYLSPLSIQQALSSRAVDEEQQPRPESKQRMIPNITTSATQFHQLGMSSDGASKEAFIHLLGHVQNEYVDQGLHVRNLHPGHIYTKLL